MGVGKMGVGKMGVGKQEISHLEKRDHSIMPSPPAFSSLAVRKSWESLVIISRDWHDRAQWCSVHQEEQRCIPQLHIQCLVSWLVLARYVWWLCYLQAKYCSSWVFWLFVRDRQYDTRIIDTWFLASSIRFLIKLTWRIWAAWGSNMVTKMQTPR